MTSLGGTEDDEANAKNAQSFPADTYFHYPAGQTPNHPFYEEFRGYPKKIYLYRKNDNNCPEAVALEYDLFTGTQKIFIAGDAELVDELPRVEELEFPAKVTSVKYSASSGCLDSLSFGLASLVMKL